MNIIFLCFLGWVFFVVVVVLGLVLEVFFALSLTKPQHLMNKFRVFLLLLFKLGELSSWRPFLVNLKAAQTHRYA